MNNNLAQAELPISVNLTVSQEDGKPVIKFSKKVCNLEEMKQFISAAWHDTPIVVIPQFSNKIKSLSSLIDKGIVYKDGDVYKFTF